MQCCVITDCALTRLDCTRCLRWPEVCNNEMKLRIFIKEVLRTFSRRMWHIRVPDKLPPNVKHYWKWFDFDTKTKIFFISNNREWYFWNLNPGPLHDDNNRLASRRSSILPTEPPELGQSSVGTPFVYAANDINNQVQWISVATNYQWIMLI